jgi:hypothetical protein
MRTPDGRECRYYYEDFHRGRSTQECRLIGANPRSEAWAPDLCAKCPVPDILTANRSPDLRLELSVRRRFGLFRRLQVDAYCVEHVRELSDAAAGCPDCRASGLTGVTTGLPPSEL